MPRSTDHEARGHRVDRERDAETAVLPHERLEVYRLSLDLRVAVMAIVPRRGWSDVRDQVDRAATSVVLNIAEGAGRFSRADKRRFFEIARASATEIAAVMDIVSRGQGAPAHRCRYARTLSVRIVQMLSRLTMNLR